MFLPVYWSSVELFLEFLMQSGQLPQEIDPKLPESAILASNTFWKETLFDRAAGGISQMHVSRIQSKALARLRDVMKSNDIDGYLTVS